VIAFDRNADIFENEKEINFAKEVMLQFGRELTPQNPLGYNDMGALVLFTKFLIDNKIPY